MAMAGRGPWLLFLVAAASACGLTQRSVLERDDSAAGSSQGGGGHASNATAGKPTQPNGGRATGGAGGKLAPVGEAGTAGAGGAAEDDPYPPDGCQYTCAACDLPTEEPQLIAQTPYEQQIVAFAVGAEHLYFGTRSNQVNSGEIGRVPLEGGDIELLVTSVQVAALAVDGTHLYYVDGPDTYGSKASAMPLVGGASQSVVLLDALPGYFLDGAQLRSDWVYFHQHDVRKLERASFLGSRELLVETAEGIWGFAADESELFWAGWLGDEHISRLHRQSLTSGEEQAAFEVPELLIGSVVVEADVYFSTSYADACRGDVHVLDRATGKVSTLSPERAGRSVYGLAADADGVYWANNGLHGGVWMYSKATGATRALALDQNQPQALAASATHVYWVDAELGPEGAYSIRAAAK